MIKERHESVLDCPFAGIQPVIRGKWSLMIVYYLSKSTLRFGELGRKLPMVTQAKLTKELRTLEEYGMVHREVYREVPPRVEYSLTARGIAFLPVVDALVHFAETCLG